MTEFKCNYDKPWQGTCQTPVNSPLERCDEHKDRVCCSCGAPATRDCSMASSMVCGAPLCDDCIHNDVRRDTVEKIRNIPLHIKKKDARNQTKLF